MHLTTSLFPSTGLSPFILFHFALRFLAREEGNPGGNDDKDIIANIVDSGCHAVLA